MEQHEWIEELFTEIRPEGFDPYVEVHSGDSYGAWEKWSGQDHIDERNPLPNELVFDVDLDTTTECYRVSNQITSFFDDVGIPYIVADTGGTGFHVHVFFHIKDLPLEHYRGARIALFELIKDDLVEHGVDEDVVRDSKKLDHGVVRFNENDSKGHLIRAIGGRKLSTGNYKTVTENWEKQQAGADDVSYPSDVDVMTISKTEYVDTPYTLEEIEERAKTIKEQEKKERERKERQAYEADGDGLDAIRSLPADEVLAALGVDASPDSMVMCKGHDDTDASLYINDDRRAICWGSCGEPGKVEYKNAIDLVEDHKDMPFSEIVTFLCEEFDMENPIDTPQDADAGDEDGDTGNEAAGQGDINFNSETFLIELHNPRRRESTSKMQARIETTHKETGDDHFAQATISARSLKQYAGTAQELMNLTDEETKELWKTILKNKTDIREAIETKNDQSDNEIDEILKAAYNYAGTPTVDEFEQRFSGFEYTARKHDDLLLINDSDRIILTEEGEERAEEILGINSPDVDVEAKAEEILEDDPLTYYLEAFEELHKGDHLLKIWELLSALSSMGDERRQIHSWAVGPSGKGKSFLKRQLTKFLPDDSYIKPSSISPKALLYLTEQEGTDYFKNKLIFFDEAQSENEEKKITLLREMTDQDNEMLTHITVKDQEPKTLVLELPVTVWFTSVESINDEQLKNRFILTNPDSSQEVDEEVFQHQMHKLHRGEDLAPPPAETPIIRRMIQMIRQQAAGLDPILPYKTRWKQKFNRRLYPFFVTIVGLVAKIHYKNREIKDGQILCTKEDFELASKIWGDLITTTIAQQDEEALKLAMALPENRSDAVTTSDIQADLPGFTTTKAYRKAMNLMETEELQLINGEQESGQWKFWAGADRDLFEDPSPEIIDDDDIFEAFVGPTNFDASDDYMKYVRETSIPVIEKLDDDEFGGVERYATDPIDTGVTVSHDSPDNTQGNDDNDGNTVKTLRTRIQEYLQEAEEASYMTINEEFDDKTEHEVEQVIDTMLDEGELVEIQPGRVRLL